MSEGLTDKQTDTPSHRNIDRNGPPLRHSTRPNNTELRYAAGVSQSTLRHVKGRKAADTRDTHKRTHVRPQNVNSNTNSSCIFKVKVVYRGGKMLKHKMYVKMAYKRGGPQFILHVSVISSHIFLTPKQSFRENYRFN